MTRYENYVNRKKVEYGEKFSDENINKAFITAFNNGDTFRVKVDFGYDKPIWGYIGATTGWKPCFLLLRKRGQHGSSETISQDAKIIDYKYLRG